MENHIVSVIAIIAAVLLILSGCHTDNPPDGGTTTVPDSSASPILSTLSELSGLSSVSDLSDLSDLSSESVTSYESLASLSESASLDSVTDTSQVTESATSGQVPTVGDTSATAEKSVTAATVAVSATPAKTSAILTTADNTPKYSPPVVLLPTAPGTHIFETSKSVIDYSNASDGYITLKYTGSQPKIIMQITAPNNRLYDLHMPADSALKAFPLSEGSGVYKITLYEGFNKDNGKVEAYHVDSQEIQVSINNPNMPFLMSNTYVNYNANSAAVAKAAEICGGKSEIEKVEVIYNWIVENISYDHDKAANVQSGYIPNLTDFMSSKKGICFDYASGMAAMLRTQGIPAKLQVGWAGTIYHAWISCYTKESGWVNFWIKFDGSKWTMMEPTFNSTVGNSESEFKNFQNFVGNSGNYQLLFSY